MFFCAALAIGLVKSGKVSAISMDRETYVRCVEGAANCASSGLLAVRDLRLGELGRTAGSLRHGGGGSCRRSATHAAPP